MDRTKAILKENKPFLFKSLCVGRFLMELLFPAVHMDESLITVKTNNSFEQF